MTAYRRWIVALLLLTVTSSTVVGSAAVAHVRWNANGWTALGAIAGAVQATAVIIGLGLVYFQVAENRKEARTRRKETIVDELAVVISEQLGPAVFALSGIWSASFFSLNPGLENGWPPEMQDSYRAREEDHYRQIRTDVEVAVRRVHEAARRADFLAIRLGHVEDLAPMRVAGKLTEFDPRLPLKREDLTAEHRRRSVQPVFEAYLALAGVMQELVQAHAPIQD